MKAILQKKIYVGFFFILFTLFSKVNNENFDIDKFQNYERQPENKKLYAQILVKGNNADINYVVSAYSDSERNKRIQLAQSFNGITKLYLSPNQIKDKIFIKLECSQYKCQGDIEFNYFEKIDLKEGETLSYYVTKENEEMEFSLIPNATSQISNIWARGQLDINTTLNESDYRKKDNYYIINHSIEKATFKVRGKSGDFINIGFIGYKKDKNDKEEFYKSNTMLTVDENIITAYLKKETLDRVCYPIQTRKCIDPIEVLFGSGIIFTKIAYSYKKNKNGKNIEGHSENNLFSLGSLSHFFYSHEIHNQSICFSFPPAEKFRQFKDIEEIILTYQITRGLSSRKGLNLYEPQINGLFYPRFLKKNEKVSFIPQNDGNFKKMTLNLMSIMGFPKMSVVDCDNYPLCELDNNKTSINKVNSSNINRFSSLSYDKKVDADYSPINRNQKLMVIECKEGEKKSNGKEYFDQICGFGTLMNREETKIELIEDQYFNKFAMKNQKDNYKIKIMKESKIDKIFIDIMTYVGDVNVITSFPSEITYSQYTSINKIYLSVKMDINSENVNELNFTVTSTSNSYYTILVNYGREEVEIDSFITNELQTGFSYLVTIDPKIDDIYGYSNKIIKFRNERSIDKMPMMINFYSLNCEIEVTSFYNSKTEIKKFKHFSHHIIEPDDSFLEGLEYRLYVKGSNSDSDQVKICKVYTSAIELSTEHEKNSRDILIPDNTPQQIMFSEKYRHASFGYVHVDFKNDLLIKFDPQHIAQYIIKLYYENVERNKSEIIVSNDVLYLSYEKEWKSRCKDSNRVCYIQLDITLNRTDFSKNPNPVLDFSIKSIASNFVSYLPKNVLTTDYIHSNRSQYYYTELNSYEDGFISINFLRGSGNVYAKIVSKSDHEENPNWRGKYKLPSSEKESLKMDTFTKKIKFSIPFNNEDKDYYLLLNVFSEVEGDFNSKNLIFPYNIFVHSYRPADLNIPLINAPLDEYVVGTVQSDRNYIYQFYSVWLNSDADQVIIDLQSSAASLFINVGNIKPAIGYSHFKFVPKGEATIYNISKTEILNILGTHSSIKDLNLTIGVWANTTETLFTTPFAFAIRLGGKENDIYRVNSEQKALCKTKKEGNKYRCLYVYLSDNNDNALFIFANAQNNSIISHLYAKYINKIDYEIEREKLREINLTKENSNFTVNCDYLYIKKGLPKEKYLLVSVETDFETIVELISSYNSNLNGVIQSPITSQMFIVKANSTFSLKFYKNNILMVNLRSIMGSAEIHWDYNKSSNYYLKGRDDRLSVTNDKLGPNNKLLIKGTSNLQDGIGFVFYANYIIKSKRNNVDSFVLYKSVNFVYTDSDLPITLYTPINSLNLKSCEYYEVFFSFNILESDQNKELTYFDDTPFNISVYITSEENINKIKENRELDVKAKKIIGVYDHGLRSGIIRFTKKFIKSRMNKFENPYLTLSLVKTSNFINKRRYKKISFETTTIQDHSKVTVSELSYHFLSLEKNETSREFLLGTDKSYKYMILQFSCAEDALSVKVKDLELKIISEDYYGKKLYSIETNEFKDKKSIILEVGRNKTEKNNSIEYFMFQYTYSNSTDKEYTIKDNTLKVKAKEGKDESDYYIKFYPIDKYEKYNITYLIRIGGLRTSKNDTLKIPKKEYISIQKEKSIVKEFYNPKVSGDLLDLNITRIKSLGSYIQVLAQINDKANVEYLSYKLCNLSNIDKQTKNNETENKDNNEGNQTPKSSEKDNFLLEWISSNTIPFIIIISILGTILILVIILVSIVCVYHKKTKSLMNNINNVSFKTEKFVEKDDDDDNILK